MDRVLLRLLFLFFLLITTACGKTEIQSFHQTFAPINDFTSPVQEFCQNAGNAEYFLNRALTDKSMRLGFKNHGGIFNGGVCWWHSRYQRNAIYLSVVRPDRPKPTATEARLIVHQLAVGKRVVELPGYSNFNEFSKDWVEAIQDKLEEWQLIDGILFFQWIRNLEAATHEEPNALSQRMDELYKEVEDLGHISWVMLKLKGLTAHAWLVTHMRPTATGYDIQYIDSNYPEETLTIAYVRGSSFIQLKKQGTVPYLGRRSDFAKYEKAQMSYCHADQFTAEAIDAADDRLENNLE